MTKDKKSIPQLKIFLDTNVIHTHTPSELVNSKVSKMIAEHSNSGFLEISWYISDTVRHERQYQMINGASEWLSYIPKIKKFFEIDFAADEPAINNRVNDLINEQLKILNLNVFNIQYTQVRWDQIANKAIYRLPPFSTGKNEKGFRDALIIESFKQFISQESNALIVLVSGDKLVRDAAQSVITSDMRVMPSLIELNVLINTLLSQVTEDFVTEMKEKAGAIFFIEKDFSTLYFKEKLHEKITERFAQELHTKPQNILESEEGDWYVQPPLFLKKKGHRLFWTSRIEPTFTGYKKEFVYQPIDPERGPLSLDLERGIMSLDLSNSDQSISTHRGLMGGYPRVPGLMNPGGFRQEKIMINYSVIFEVNWSVHIDNHKNLTDPKIEEIKYAEVVVRLGA
ncbi:MAG: PIN domain-containing protein [Candidatus Nitrotoga sp.]